MGDPVSSCLVSGGTKIVPDCLQDLRDRQRAPALRCASPWGCAGAHLTSPPSPRGAAAVTPPSPPRTAVFMGFGPDRIHSHTLAHRGLYLGV